MTIEHQTKIELAGAEMPAIVEYGLDGPGVEDVCIESVRLRRCVAQRGDVVYHPDGDYHFARFPEFIELEIFRFLRGSQLKAIAEEIMKALKRRIGTRS